MKRLFFALMALTSALTASAQASDDFGVWGEFSIEKALTTRWDLGLETHFRTQDNSTCLDRWGVGVNAAYRVHKYLKLAAGIELLNAYTPKKYKTWKNAGWDVDADDGIATRRTGYNETNAYFTPKFRFKFDIISSVKIAKWVRIGIRERYRFARVGSVNALRVKYRKTDTYTATDLDDWQWELTDEGEWTADRSENKEEEAYSNHQLRSRLKVSLDRKRLPWHPYISGELFNDISNSMELYRIRTHVGCEYDINKHHAISLAYVLTFNKEDDGEGFGERFHATSISYSIKY